MAYEDYDVLSYFINVGVGDSALHVLQRRDPPHVEATVMIDGGKFEARHRIKKVIAGVRADLNHTAAFTSIVITHWDLDHFCGLMALLYDRWKASDADNPPPQYIDDSTTFYCPWKGVNSLQSWNRNMRVKLDEYEECYWLEFRTNSNSDFQTVCRAVVSTYTMGRDLFAGLDDKKKTQEPPSLWPSSLSQVYAHAPDLVAFAKPIFLVYGVEGLSFSHGSDEWFSPKAPSVSKNDSSIMALVIWPERDAAKPMRVSLYTGGDVTQDPIEDQLAQWLVHGPREMKLDVVKASHHGSHYSTNEVLLMQKMQYFVISAGHSHGHPSK